jgi:hypothetical protein
VEMDVRNDLDNWDRLIYICVFFHMGFTERGGLHCFFMGLLACWTRIEYSKSR